jgi:hypothetical protein
LKKLRRLNKAGQLLPFDFSCVFNIRSYFHITLLLIPWGDLQVAVFKRSVAQPNPKG